MFIFQLECIPTHKKRIMSCAPNRIPPLIYLNARHFSAVQFLCVALILTWLVSQIADRRFALAESGDMFFF